MDVSDIRENPAIRHSDILPVAFVVCITTMLAFFSGHGIADSIDSDISRVMASSGVKSRSEVNPRTGNIRFLDVEGTNGFRQSTSRSATPDSVARELLTNFGESFGVFDVDKELKLVKQHKSRNSRSRHSVKFQQYRDGIPIFGAELVVRLNDGMAVTGANGNLSSSIQRVSFTGTRQENINQARAYIKKQYPKAKSSEFKVGTVEKIIFNAALFNVGPDLERAARLIEISHRTLDIHVSVIIDAETSSVLFSFPNIHRALVRTVFDQQNTSNLPDSSAILKRSEGGIATGDSDVDNAYQYAGDTYNFFLNEHGRDSIDGAGLPLTLFVRQCIPSLPCPMANAYWHNDTMNFGQGWTTDDVTAHELVHGFTQYTSNLVYALESGAINESLSDMWGEWVDLVNDGGTDTEAVRWLIGEDIPGFGSIRDMKNPPMFNDPDSINSSLYNCGPNTFANDYGGVHTNSGVNNKAAYLMTDGGTFNGQSVSALGIEKTAAIYYQAQTSYLTSSSTYFDLNNSLISSCSDLVGIKGITAADCNQVNKALAAVEMDQATCSAPPLVEYCPANTIKSTLWSEDFEAATVPGLSNWGNSNLIGGSLSSWIGSNHNPFNGTNHLHGENLSSVTDITIKTNTNEVLSQAIASGASVKIAFNHAPDLEGSYDGGVVEFSTNDGGTWNDLLKTYQVSGFNYNAIVEAGYSNPLAGRESFSGVSDYGRTVVTLPGAISNESFDLRFRIGTDTIISAPGWDIDDVHAYQCRLPKYCAGKLVTVDIGAGEVPTEFDDVILGTIGPDTIFGLGGDDLICAGNGNDTVFGGNGDDVIYAGALDDVVHGGNGADTIWAGTGNDRVYGGTDQSVDYIYGQNGADELYDQGGYGFTYGGGGNDSIYSGADGGYISGGNNADILVGSNYVDVIYGQHGADTIHGWGADDFLYGGNSRDSINGGGGNDYISGGALNDALIGGAGNDSIDGGPANDTISGGAGIDYLNGGSGNDDIYGGAGNDILIGGPNNDALNGQAGVDVCDSSAGIDTETVTCESYTGTSVLDAADNLPPSHLLPQSPLSEQTIILLDQCDLTMAECLAQ